MIISCEQCNKKFEINSEQIPDLGRFLECGSCGHKWFFNSSTLSDKKNVFKEKKVFNEKLNDEKNLEKNFDSKTIGNNPIINIKQNDKDDKLHENNKIKNKTNFLKIFIVFIISLVALIIVLDTFQKQLSLFIPNIDLFIINLYTTMYDFFLLFKNLIIS